MESILVVDEDQAYRELLTDILASEGYRVLPADSAQLALSSIGAQPPDLVLVDARTAGVDKFEFGRHLRTLTGNGSSGSRPLILMSAAIDANARVEGLANGAVDFILKPFQQEELLARVRTHLELRRLRYNPEMERVNSLQVLACGVSHDFANLMASILATAELAETEFAEGLSPCDEIQTIKTVARQAIEMARELMIYAGKDKGKFELLDLTHLVEQMADMLRGSILKRCVLKSDLPKALPRIWGNSTHIRQIVMNLIINAFEAIGDTDGTIHLRISRTTHKQRPHLKIGNKLPDGDYLRLEVSDTGCGITEEQRTRIFDPFFSTKQRGSGLGLAVVQELVQSHGGVINVSSELGRGATFEIFFPCFEQNSKMTVCVGSPTPSVNGLPRSKHAHAGKI